MNRLVAAVILGVICLCVLGGVAGIYYFKQVLLEMPEYASSAQAIASALNAVSVRFLVVAWSIMALASVQ